MMDVPQLEGREGARKTHGITVDSNRKIHGPCLVSLQFKASLYQKEDELYQNCTKTEQLSHNP